MDLNQLSAELYEAYISGAAVAVPPSSLNDGFDMQSAYTVAAQVDRMRRDAGSTAVGRKVGYASKAMWRILKLNTLVWGFMYSDTVHYASSAGDASLSLRRMYLPQVEPEVVFRLKAPLESGADAKSALEAVEWIALGLEINNSVFTDSQFKPVDFVAAYGFHAGLIVGEPRRVEAGAIPALVERLPNFKVRLLKNGELIAEGSGKNSLRSPALCLAELASAVSSQSGVPPLGAGELVSTGTLTDPVRISPGEEWTAEVDGIDLPTLRARFTE
jgi:2-oxo-3-hexenedioate decarboxylase